jgi:hypothetical protein
MPLPVKGEVVPVTLIDPATGLPITISVVSTPNPQVQGVDQVLPLAANTATPANSRDCILYESFGISCFVKAGAGSLNVTVLVENSLDGATWDPVDTIQMVDPAIGAGQSLNRVYSVTRQFYRVSAKNNDAVNALAVTRLVDMRKPV